LFAPVDIIAEEEVVGLGREAAHLEHPDQVGVLLPVNQFPNTMEKILTCPWTSPTILTGGLSSISVGCDRNTSLAAAQTLAISAFLSGGDLVTFPL